MRTLIAAGLSINASGVLAAPDFKEGLWEICTQVEIPQSPLQMPKMIRTECMSNEKFIPELHEQQHDDCKISTPQVRGDTVTWNMACKSPDSSVAGKGEIHYRGNSFNGAINMQISETEGGTVTMKNKMTGRYIGPCDIK